MPKEYIEREAVIGAVEGTDWYHVSTQGTLVHGAISDGNALYKADDIYEVLSECPAADVVEVVRCKDCKHYGTSGCAMDAYAFDVVEEGYCSYGERKEV